MNAVINRITRMAERIAPNLRTSGANLGLAHAMPAHWNESVSVIRTTAALVWRMKIMCKGGESHLELIAIEPCRGNLLFVNPRLSAPPKEALYIRANA